MKAEAGVGAVYLCKAYIHVDVVTPEAEEALKRYGVEAPEELEPLADDKEPTFRVWLPEGTVGAPRQDGVGDPPIAYGMGFLMPDFEFLLVAEAEKAGDPITLRVLFSQPENAHADEAK
jgi:hypothetical protein